MNRAVFGSLIAAALVLALAFRLPGLERRPMHHDEANQALKFGTLLEQGHYRYDRVDHHGPTLYYLTLPSAWLRGQTTLASLDERTLRVVPALFGAGLILLIAGFASGLGRTAVVAAAFLAALSPAFTFYSRFYIQESIFTGVALGGVWCLGRYVAWRRQADAVWAGVFAGLAYATKETSVLVMAAAVAAAALAAWTTTRAEGRVPVWSAADWRATGIAAAGALAVAFVFYSSFFENPRGLLESFGAFGIYLERGTAPGPHVQPWGYYLRLLGWHESGGVVWTEGVVLVLAFAGIVAASAGGTGFWGRYVAWYAVLSIVLFSSVRYKTPWNVLPSYAGVMLAAGVGFVALVRLARARWWTAAVFAVVTVAAIHLGDQNVLANGRYAADERNPWVYAHTSDDFLRLVRRIDDLAAVHPDRRAMLVKVLAGPYEQWPLPWYTRHLTQVGYWPRAAEAGPLEGTPVIVASEANATAVEALGDRYVSEYYGLRPGVFLTLSIERGLWERYLAARH